MAENKEEKPICYGGYRECNGCLLCDFCSSCEAWSEVMRDRLLDMRENG